MPPRPPIRGIQAPYVQIRRCRQCQFGSSSTAAAETPRPTPPKPSPPRKSTASSDRRPSGLLSALAHKPIEGPFTSSLFDVNREAMEQDRAEAKRKRRDKGKGKAKEKEVEVEVDGQGQREGGVEGEGQGEKKVVWTIPMLPHPLGVLNPPIESDTTWNQELPAEERKAARRDSLLKEASRGYFHDFNRVRKMHGGKLWVAPPVLIREDKALYFPNIAGKNLNSEKSNTTKILEGKVSLVSIISTRLSEEQVRTLVPPVLEDQEGKPGFAYVQINHQPNRLKSMLLSFFVSSLQRTIPSNRWSDYLLTHGEWTDYDIRDPLGLENSILGYVYLVDWNCKIRWAACANAEEKEIHSLRNATAVLMARLEKDRQEKESGA
ncbi:ATP10 protein-domain-containing protein [Naematelia encephala]|uniref:ATP10 protein-domain-containing protein n=1 Tax=Naematelia encephala TaxID=71784 RepID=A0A1Y2BMK3_9TREE|nr:ATP10 protein-domain-containing protein [Naematelia encephala]